MRQNTFFVHSNHLSGWENGAFVVMISALKTVSLRCFFPQELGLRHAAFL